MSDYDVIVLGSGPGGGHCAGQLADAGLRVAIVERELLGGECDYQLTIWTIVPELDAELHSSYLGHPDGNTAVAHRWLQPGAAPVTTSELRPGHEMPVREARRLCLYEHLAELRRLVADATGEDTTVDVADQALALVDVA